MIAMVVVSVQQCCCCGVLWRCRNHEIGDGADSPANVKHAHHPAIIDSSNVSVQFRGIVDA